VKGEARLKVGKREGVGHCPTRTRKREREGRNGLTRDPRWVVPPYICLLAFVMDLRTTDLPARCNSLECHCGYFN